MKQSTREHLIPLDARCGVLELAIEIELGETLVVETINHMRPIVRNSGGLSIPRDIKPDTYL